MGKAAPGSIDSLVAADRTMYRLLVATLKHEKLVALRDLEIAGVQRSHELAIEKAAGEMIDLEADLEAFCIAHPETLEADKKSVQLAHGLMGLRTSPPSLVPLNEKWTWEKIALKLRAVWKSKYFHKPKPPGIDKVKVKKDLNADELKGCGMKLDAPETFYLELNRLALPAEQTASDGTAA